MITVGFLDAEQSVSNVGVDIEVRAAAGGRVLDGVVNSGEFGLVVRAISGDEEGLAAEDIAVFGQVLVVDTR